MNRTFNLEIDFTKENIDFDPYFNPEDKLLHFFPEISPKDILINLKQNNFPDFNYINNGNYNFLENMDSDSKDEDYLFKKSKNILLFNIDKIAPKPFLEEEINILIKKMNMSKEMKIKYLLDSRSTCDKIERVKEKILLNFNERRKKMKMKKKIKKELDVKFGRKKKDDKSDKGHDKYSLDNLTNKIKNYTYRSLVLFLNKLLNSLYTKNQLNKMFCSLDLPKIVSNPELIKVIKDNDYSSISYKIKKDENLEILKLTIKNLLSKKISKKYVGIPDNYNVLIINKIFKDQHNKKIYDFIFNHLKFEDWLDIFIYKKELNEFANYNSLDKNQKNIIKNNLVGIDFYFPKLYKDNKIYFHCFIILIYNFVRFLMIKERRNFTKA